MLKCREMMSFVLVIDGGILLYFHQKNHQWLHFLFELCHFQSCFLIVFVMFRCQFVVVGSVDDYAINAIDPDKLVDWDHIQLVVS